MFPLMDFDIYATINFVRWAGVQVGYRRFELDYRFENDSGNLLLEGPYVGGVLRY